MRVVERKEEDDIEREREKNDTTDHTINLILALPYQHLRKSDPLWPRAINITIINIITNITMPKLRHATRTEKYASMRDRSRGEVARSHDLARTVRDVRSPDLDRDPPTDRQDL